VESQKTLVMKVVGIGKTHISTKNGVKIRKFAIELAQTMITCVENQVNSCLVPFFVNSFSLKYWYAMFGIFSKYYITYHDSMRWFSIF
jgi:cytochrome b subunit of formate dehydrogenase